jgi:hypothetical protein
MIVKQTAVKKGKVGVHLSQVLLYLKGEFLAE